ncbi:hypothetical protein M0657_006830 [Pyricularia oryzae]|nr:hypothetical protein M0657_006830 [Pyricularia oryzae]KAI7926979.1 hypothetical protein M9X92_002467 [Pyricularia oryzae]
MFLQSSVVLLPTCLVGCRIDRIMASRHLLGCPQNATRLNVACMFMNMTMRLADGHLAHWHRYNREPRPR